MEKSIKKVVPTQELLQEMEELEVLGGSGGNDVAVYALSNCKPTYSGNCVVQCGCTISKDDEDDDDGKGNPSKP